ncbi:hypothetical protein HFO33_31155 [Rhizobium leguminosarum]|nr:hypothetical protein [Rhizobium leguminosarum]
MRAMMRRTKMAMIGATAALLALAGVAQCEETRSPFQRFAERCLEHGPRYDQTVALARESGWPDLAEDMTMGIQPLGEPATFQGWLVNSDGTSPFEAVVVARGAVGPKTVESCTMAFAGTDAAAFESSFASTGAARPSGEQKGQGRVRKFFAIEREGVKEALTLDLPIYPNGADEVVASVVSEQRIEN